MYFSSCHRCGKDLIRSGDRWKRVPRGLRVAWHRQGGQAGARHFQSAPPHRVHGLSAVVDTARVAGRALYWKTIDTLTVRTARPQRAIRLPYRPVA